MILEENTHNNEKKLAHGGQGHLDSLIDMLIA